MLRTPPCTRNMLNSQRLRPQSIWTLALKLLSTMLTSIGLLWVLTMLITRVHLFHNAYIHHLQIIEDEKWLLQQCHDPAFFSNLKQHVALCTQVQENAQRNPVLVALDATLATSSLCGTVACSDVMYYMQTGGFSLISLLALGALALIVVIIPAANVLLRFVHDWAYNNDARRLDPLERGQYNNSGVIAAVRDDARWFDLQRGGGWMHSSYTNKKIV